MEQEIIFKKLESIQNELNSLKNIFLKKSKCNNISLKGMLKTIDITNEDVADAKRSLFHHL